MNFANKAELVQFLTDLQGQITNLQETVDKLAPVEEAAAEGELLEDTGGEAEAPAAELDEIDSLLQED